MMKNVCALSMVVALTSVSAAAPANEPEVLGSKDSEMAGTTTTDAAEQPPENIMEALKTLYKDDELSITWGGRLMFDAGWFSSDDMYPSNDEGSLTFPNDEDGVEFRRARIFAEGTLHDTVKFKTQYDFADGSAGFRDVYMAWSAPFGKVQVGHFYEPFGLEQVTSSKYITFMERAMPIEAFAPERNSGVMLTDTVGDNMFYSIGVFRETDSVGEDTGDGDYAVTGRLAGSFLTDDDSADVLHLGIAASQRAGVEDERFRTRPEAHLLSRVFDTGELESDGTTLLGGEAAWVNGPVSLQGEYFLASVDELGGAGSQDVDFSGWYAYVSYFLTGESRNYKGSSAKFDRVKVRESWNGRNFDGAWEAALRYSMVDFDDGPFTAEVNNITLGLNWYLNKHSRLMWNWVHSTVEDDTNLVDDDMDALMMRFQVDW